MTARRTNCGAMNRTHGVAVRSQAGTASLNAGTVQLPVRMLRGGQERVLCSDAEGALCLTNELGGYRGYGPSPLHSGVDRGPCPAGPLCWRYRR